MTYIAVIDSANLPYPAIALRSDEAYSNTMSMLLPLCFYYRCTRSIMEDRKVIQSARNSAEHASLAIRHKQNETWHQ